MNIKMIKKFALAALYFATCCISAVAQFNTIFPKEKIPQNATDNLVADAQGIDSVASRQVQNVQAVTIDESKRYILDGMKKSQYLALPIDELIVNSPYGYRIDPINGKRKFHKGVDLNADFNYVYSVMPGKVVKSGRNRELGEFVQVEHGEFITTYGHLFQRLVNTKEAIEAGQPVGISGSSGRSTGEHLHFSMSFKGKSIDPMPILNYIGQVMQEAKKEVEKAINNLNIKQ